MPSNAFTVNGNTNPAAHVCAYTSTVTLAIANTFGLNTITWTIAAASQSGVAFPTVTPAGAPYGATASFVMPIDPGNGLGLGFLVRCRAVTNGGDTLDSYAVLGALNAASIVPLIPGELDYRNATHGWGEDLNRAIATGGGGGSAPTIFYKSFVDYATKIALPAHTRVGNVLTMSANGAIAIDGLTPVTGKRVLVKDEGASPLEHGVYDLVQGTVSTPAVLSRSSDWNTSDEFPTGATSLVINGTQAGQLWYLATPAPITPNVTALAFAKTAGGSGITLDLTSVNGAALTDANATIYIAGGQLRPIKSAFTAARTFIIDPYGATNTDQICVRNEVAQTYDILFVNGGNLGNVGDPRSYKITAGYREQIRFGFVQGGTLTIPGNWQPLSRDYLA